MADTPDEESQSFLLKLGLSAVTTALAHPVTYVKVLIQVGHEPLPPVASRTFLGKEILRLPNFIEYANHIRKTDGFLGLYRGLGPRIAHHLLCSTVSNAVVSRLEKKEPAQKSEDDLFDPDDGPLPLREYVKETCVMTVGKTVGLIASHPLHLISVRMMVQFVGKETIYSNVFSSIKEIYNEEGIWGFFSGLMASLIGELVAFWISRALSYGIETFVIHDEWMRMAKVNMYTRAVSQIGSGMATYPFHLVANIMAVNTPRLAAGSPPNMPLYSNWIDCWKSLSKQRLLRRGESIIVRNLPRKA